MKKVFLFLALALFCTVTRAQNGRIDLRSQSRAEITKSEFKTIRAVFSYGSIESMEIQTEKGAFSEIGISGTYPSGEIGSPELPATHELLAVPFGAKPTVSVVSFSTTDYKLSDYGINTVAPRQPSVRKDQKPEDVKFAYNESAYKTRALATAPEATIEVQGTMRGIRIGSLAISPVSYNAASNTLRVFNDIEVEISFDGADYAETEKMLVNTYSPYFDVVYKQMFNSRQIQDVYSEHPDLMAYPVNMMVIAPESYISTLQPWTNWKIQKGFNVEVYTTAQAGSSYNSIRSFVQNKYNTGVSTGKTPTFLILVGDVAQVPNTTGSSSGKVTDLYYGSVDDDYFPDMFYSRMSAENTSQLTAIIDKVLQYEQYTMPDPSYLNNVLLIAGWDATYNPRLGQPTINYATANYYNSAHGFTNVYAHLNQSQYSGCYNSLSTGVGFANYTAHGGETCWADPRLNGSDISSLTNTNKYFLAMGNCCVAANFGYSSPCFGETMIRTANKGAYSYIGSCPNTYWYEDYYFGVGATSITNGTTPSYSQTSTGVYDAVWMDETYNTVSSMVFVGNLAVCHAANGGGKSTYYWQAYHVLGDGSIMPYRVQPTANTVSHAQTFPMNESTFTVNAQPGSYVGISKDNVLLGAGLVPASGSISINIVPVTSPGNVKIVVTKPQRQPYIATLTAGNGGTVHTDSDTFYDTGGPNGNYSNNEDYTVTYYPATTGKVIEATFTSFTTENNYDKLYVYDGTSTSATLVGTYTGTTSPGTIAATNTAGALTFRFTSDYSVNKAGWAANIQAVNNGPVEIHTDSDTFYDTGGANGNYSNNEDYTVTYYPATTGKAIKASFTSFTLENNYDKLYVYDGTSTSATLVGTYTGTTSPGTITATNIAGALTFRFTSDYSVNKSGWAANINAIYIKTDNGNLYDSGGASGNYSCDEDHAITYYPATTGKAIKASFTSFTLENSYDKLYVYDGTSTSATLVGTYTGTTSPGTITATNIAGALTFRFTSDYSVTKAGWAASISVVDNIIRTNSGYFYDSGGANDNYTNSETSVVTYYPSSSGKAMTFNFTSFTLENNYDKLYVYNGTSTDAALIGTYTGTTSPGTITASNPAGALTFKFTSDGSVVKSGWAASISTVNNASSFTVRTDSDNFYDTGGPNANYSNSENYTVTYYPATIGKAIKAAFSSFTLENSYDKLYVYDGTSTSATLIGTYTGTTSPGTITATNIAGALTFRFTSDYSVNKAGWAAGISVVDNIIRTNNGYFYDSGGANGDYACNETSVITYYPSTSDKALRFTFNSFNLENSWDKLYVYNGTTTSAPLIGTYTWTSSPGTITASNPAGALTFKFTSDYSVTKAGWAASISTVSNSTSFTVRTDSDNFYDTGGPNANYCNYENYTVTYYPATTGKAIKAAFSSFTLENSYDKLYVYDGTSTSATLIGTYTGTTSPGTITATNIAGALTFRFTSDYSVNNAGWAAGISVVDNVIRTNNGYFYDSGGANGDYVCSETGVITYYPSTSGKALKFTFNSFNLENSWDKLYVYNGTSTSAQLIGTYTGTTSPGTITANNSYGALTFRFTSDGSVVRAGWKATITVVNKSKGDDDNAEEVVISNDEMTVDADITIYPNPVRDMLTVKANGMKQVTIFNLQGQAVYTQDVDDNMVSINMSDFASGMYIVRIATKEGVQSKQIIVE